MRIGVVTIFDVPNYGANLQCYSLCKYLRGLGHEVVLFKIPFSPKPASWKGRLLKPFRYGFKRRFVSKYLPHTMDYGTPVDMYVVGSDQVWNPQIVYNAWPKYMLDFAPKGTPRISYASSFGVESWPEPESAERAQRLLSRFDHITVRETTGVMLLKRDFGLDGTMVLDPCFLNDDLCEFYDPKGRNDNTLVLFNLQPRVTDWDVVCKQMAAEMGCKFVDNSHNWYIPTKRAVKGLNCKYRSIKGWIKNMSTAGYVITDSFHGMVFAMIYKRQFVVINNSLGRFTRIQSLLERLGLTQRIATDISQAKQIFETDTIDYSRVSAEIEAMKRESRSLLDGYLAEIEQKIAKSGGGKWLITSILYANIQCDCLWHIQQHRQQLGQRLGQKRRLGCESGRQRIGFGEQRIAFGKLRRPLRHN